MIPRRRRPMKKGRKRIKLHNEAKIPEGGSILSDLSNKKNTSNSPTRFHRKHYKKKWFETKKKKIAETEKTVFCNHFKINLQEIKTQNFNFIYLFILFLQNN